MSAKKFFTGIAEFAIEDVVSNGNKIAFRVKYCFIDQHNNPQEAENMGIFHLNDRGKIERLWVKSSEQFGQE